MIIQLKGQRKRPGNRFNPAAGSLVDYRNVGSMFRSTVCPYVLVLYVYVYLYVGVYVFEKKSSEHNLLESDGSFELLCYSVR